MDATYDDQFNLAKPKIVQKTVEKALEAILAGLYKNVYDLANKVETDQSMVTFEVKINETKTIKVEVIKVSSVTYVRVSNRGDAHIRGYIMQSTQSSSDIYELKAECKFPE